VSHLANRSPFAVSGGGTKTEVQSRELLMRLQTRQGLAEAFSKTSVFPAQSEVDVSLRLHCAMTDVGLHRLGG
jgi:hypothetical protein